MVGQVRGEADYYARGDWNAQCYVCGGKFKASALKRHWQGYWVCEKDWEPRHPQDFVRSVKDNMTPPWTQPWPDNPFVIFCTPNGTSALPAFAMPGCALPGYISPMFDPNVTTI